MKVCDVVLNSIWHDPRVRKQINEYIVNGVDLSCVGVKCKRYDSKRIADLPCKTIIVEPDSKYAGKQKNVFRKLKREHLLQKAVCKAILEQKPDIIHANDLNALIPAYMASRKLKCKLIYDSHEINTKDLYFRDKRLYAFILRMEERFICKRVVKMICVSNSAAEYFAKYYNIEKPMVITNCTLKSDQCNSTKKNDGFEIINHGQFLSGRGYDIMVEALPLLKEYSDIKIALRGVGSMGDKLCARAEELGNDNFRFYEPVHVSELVREASKSMVGVAITEPICINFKLSVSNKLFEYAAAGLPVIMSDIPEHRYLNEKFKFGIIIDENTPQQFADAVVKLYEDREFYLKCSDNARRLSNEIYWEKEFSKLIYFEKNLYENEM